MNKPYVYRLFFGSVVLILSLLITLSVNAQYCNPTYSSGCTSSDYIQSFSTSGGITNISNPGTGCAVSTGISTYLSMTHTALLGQTVNFSFTNTPSFSEYYRIFVDWNNDGDLVDAGEEVYVSTNIGAGVTVNGSFTVPLTATPGVVTRMRIMCVYATASFVPCGSYSFGEIEDYSFVINAPCNGVPSGYTVGAPYQVCPNTPFYVSLAGQPRTNITYQWEYSYNGTSWAKYTGMIGTFGDFTDSITVAKWYRCKLICTNSGQTFTTPPWLVSIAPFYFCYCKSTANATTGLDVGNVKIIKMPLGGVAEDTILNNGTGTPLLNNTNANRNYTSFQSLVPPIAIYRDSQYRALVTQINSKAAASAGSVVMFIDYDRNGEYDTVTERVFHKTISNPSGYDADTFTVPMTAEIGLTGMRVIISSTGSADPCSSFAEGETEDYIVDLRYEPCKGAIKAGFGQGDTAVCLGYDYVVTDTTYEHKKSDMTWSWQTSADNVLWYTTVNSTSKDTLMRIFTGQPLYYRMQVVCNATKDTTYGIPIFVNQKSAYKCYCYSQATGGKLNDTSDIGGFSLAGYVNNDGGTHLDNAKAYHKHTDHTDEQPIMLNVDSLYQITTFHTMRGAEHADAKITIFMDFNNDHDYDIPAERIFTGYTSVGNFTLVDQLTIPPLAIMDVPTGMRVILNNDVAPNYQSDEACGAFTSGETEDYMVTFHKSFPATINDMGLMRNVSIYPNPTTGKFVLLLNTTYAVKEINVSITDVTGQKIKHDVYQHDGGQFIKELDLTGMSKGVYFVELQTGGEKIVRRVVLQ